MSLYYLSKQISRLLDMKQLNFVHIDNEEKSLYQILQN